MEFAKDYDYVDVSTGWVNNDKDAYEISNENGTLTVKKNESWVNNANETQNTDWCFIKKELNVTADKYTTLVIEFTGDVAGQELIFALGTKEAKPFTNGERQYVEIAVEKIAANELLKIFVNPGKSGSCTLVITDMYLK